MSTDTEATQRARWQEHMPLGALAGNERNPKEHDLPELERSVGRLGFIDPVILDERTGTLISGHGRVDLLKALRDRDARMRADLEAWEAAPEGGRGERPPEPAGPPEGIEPGEGDWLVPVSRGWASKDDDDAKAALIGLNRLVERGGWNGNLADMLEELDRSERPDPLAGTGYVKVEVDAMLAALAPPEAPPEFRRVDEDTITTEYRCPSCSYEWSGKPK